MKKILKKIVRIQELENKPKIDSIKLSFESVNKVNKTLAKLNMKNIEGSSDYHQKWKESIGTTHRHCNEML